jgi:LysM repeat protein
MTARRSAAERVAENLAQLSADQRLGITHYVVKRGDSLASVALKFHTSVTELRELNDRPTGGIAAGDDLRMPGEVTELPAKVMFAAGRVDGRGRSGHTDVQVVRP